MNIIAGTTSQFQNIPKLQSLLKQSIKKASRIIKELELTTNKEYIESRETQYTTDDDKPYKKMTEQIYLKSAIDGYSCYVSHGDTRPILWLDLLPKKEETDKIFKNMKNASINIPDNIWVHEAYHLIAGIEGKELRDYPSVEDLCKNEEEVIATYMEILFLESQGYDNDKIAIKIEVFKGSQSEMNKFLELTSKYRT